jgi:phasin family protein
MYPFSQSVTPAVRTHLDAQTAFMNDVSKSLFQSFQQICNLNIQLVQTMLEETALAGQQILTADRQTEVLSAAASRAQPTTEKLRAYQQHISRLAADTQVEFARVTEQHVQNTTRTARQLADEVARNASEETQRGLRQGQDTLQRFVDPFTVGNGQDRGQDRGYERAQGGAQGNGGASMQSASNGAGQGSIPRPDGNPGASQSGKGVHGA